MAKQDNTIFWIVGVVVVVALVISGFKFDLFTVSGATMLRSVPSQASPSSTFEIVYSVTGDTGKWGASIIDTVSGGCKFPDGSTTLKTVMLSTEGSVKRITVTTPSSEGKCTFSGDYKFGTEATRNFQTGIVEIISGSDAICPAIVGYKYFNGECVYTDDGCEVEYSTLKACQEAMGIINGNGEPLACPKDIKQCPDGTWVLRNPYNNCEFYPCITNGKTIPSFDLNQVLFKVGNVEVTIIMLIIGLLAVMVLLRVLGSRR